MPAVQVRWTRRTNNLGEIIRFYKDGLKLSEIGSFQDQEGYSGIMFGLPGFDYHLEFTVHEEGEPLPPPDKDNLLVFYIPDTIRYEELIEHLQSMGYKPYPPETSYWSEDANIFEDPDGRRVVLSNTSGI